MGPGTLEPPRLDGFSLVLPLPYRVAVILVAGKSSGIAERIPIYKRLTIFIGVWGWGLNVQYLTAVKIVRVETVIKHQACTNPV